LNVPNLLPASVNDSWVTVFPKKRVKALIQARPKSNSILNPIGESSSRETIQTSPSNYMPCPNPAPLGPDDIILANTLGLKQGKTQITEGDPLDALNLGVEVEANMDVFLNLQNIEDVDMSMDYFKRRRIEEAEEASSRGPS